MGDRERAEHVAPSAEPQHGKPGGLKQQPRTDRAGLGKSFEDRNAVAGIRQQDRRGLAGDAAADDADLEGTGQAQSPSFTARRAQSPPFTTRHWPLT